MAKCLWILLSMLFALTLSGFAEEGLPKLIDAIEPSIVTIQTYDSSGKDLNQGSGFFINDQGYIITRMRDKVLKIHIKENENGH